MTRELLGAGLSRIVIPTVLGDDYLDSLRALSRRDDPSIFVRSLEFSQRVSAAFSASPVSHHHRHRGRAAGAEGAPDAAIDANVNGFSGRGLPKLGHTMPWAGEHIGGTEIPRKDIVSVVKPRPGFDRSQLPFLA